MTEDQSTSAEQPTEDDKDLEYLATKVAGSDTRAELRTYLLAMVETGIDQRAQTIEGGPLDGIRVVSLGHVSEAIEAVARFPLAPPDAHTAELTTPFEVVTHARCPRCGVAAPMYLRVNDELRLNEDGQTLRLTAKSKPISHVCGQLPITFEQAAGQEEAFDITDIVGPVDEKPDSPEGDEGDEPPLPTDEAKDDA